MTVEQTHPRSPVLLSGFGDDLRASLVRTFDHLIDSRIGFRTQVEDTFALPVLRNLVIADDPVEAAVGTSMRRTPSLRANCSGSGMLSSAGSPMGSKSSPSW